jgi:opacity protein-like surface antigen
MKSFAATLGMMAMMAGPMLAGGVQEKKAASVAGRWTMTVEGGAHGVTTMGLALTQDGKKVTGTFASPHGDMPVKGEFADGTLTLATISKEADAQPITFNAKLKDDTLTGYISSAMGDMTWTATRVKDGR